MNLRVFLYSILCFILIVMIIFGASAYRYYTILHSNDPKEPRIIVIDGEAKILRSNLAIILKKEESYILEENDVIETGLQSKVTITWPDESITRLGPETRITIKKMQVAKDYSTLRIAYEMEQGKSWNKVIRLIIGDSYFRVRLPKENVVAGVRGTTFEVNLDIGYIRAVHHATEVEGSWGKKLILLPGDIVESSNISETIDESYKDSSWEEWNNLSDSLYEATRTKEIQENINKLSDTISVSLNIDTLSREVLRNIPGFEGLNISQGLVGSQNELIEKYSPEVLLEYYQKFSTPSLPDYRGKIRTSILEKIEENAYYAPLKKILETTSLWESFDLKKMLPDTEKILENAEIIIRNGVDDISNTLDPKIFINAYSGKLKEFLEF